MILLEVAEVIVLLFAIYILAGVLFALIFVFSGVTRLDPVAKGSPILFRLMILPGSAALWPYLMIRLIRRGRVDAPSDTREASL